MPIQTKTVTKFVTEDGREFDSIEQAQAEQLSAMVPTAIKEQINPEWIVEFCTWMVDARQPVISILSWSVDQKPKKERKPRADRGKKRTAKPSNLPEDQ